MRTLFSGGLLVIAVMVSLVADANSQLAALRPSLTPEQLLERQGLTMDPQINPVSGTIAYLIADPSDESQIKSFKATGILAIESDGHRNVFSDIGRVYDHVWSTDGNKIAFFSGFGSNRRLIVMSVPGNPDTARIELDFKIAGEFPRKSARFFKPIWLPGSATLLVTRATLLDPISDLGKSFSLTSGMTTTRLDRHFRDDTVRALFLVEVGAAAIKQVSPASVLRKIMLSPDGRKVWLVSSDSEEAGGFIGDEYVRSPKHSLLDLEEDRMVELSVEGTKVLGWLSSREVLIQTGRFLAVFDPVTGLARPFSDIGSERVTHFVVGDKFLAFVIPEKSCVGGPNYLIAPPMPEQVMVIERNSAASQAVVGLSGKNEVLDLLVLPDQGQVAVHSRALDSLDEAISIFRPDAGTTRTLISGPFSFSDLHAGNRAKTLVLMSEDWSGRVSTMTLDIGSSAANVIYASASVLSEERSTPPRLISFEDADGRPRKALLYLPPGHVKDAQTPMIVTAYGRLTDGMNRFQSEAIMHTTRGYAYLMPDVFVYRKRLDQAYTQTIPAAIKAAREKFGINGPVGFYGGSLGGFAGLTLATKTSVLDTAALRAAPSEFALSWATGKDRDADLLEYLMAGATPFSDKALYDENSPFWRLNAVQAPILLLHGDDDMQVPLEQGIWVYQALRRLGKVVELRVYPGADHSIVRSNRSYFIDYYERIFNWWETHLVSEASVKGVQR